MTNDNLNECLISLITLDKDFHKEQSLYTGRKYRLAGANRLLVHRATAINNVVRTLYIQR
jgi:hypothetical protein